MKKLLLLTILLGCEPTLALAQRGASPQANCRGQWTATLASGRPHGDLSRCWSVLQPDVVAAITRMRSSSNIARIHMVVNTASGYRTPAVLRAALSVVADRHATHPARMGGFAIAMSQYRRNAFPLSSSTALGGYLVNGVTFECQWNANYVSHDVEASLPGDYLDQIRSVAKSVVETPDEAVSLRSYAGCVIALLDEIAPVKVPASAISVRYRCGSIFVLTNSSAERVEVRFQVGDGEDETGTLDVPPHGERLLPTISTGRVRVFVGDDLAGTAENGGTPCR